MTKVNQSAFPIPRIRGKVGQATEPVEVAGKWFFDVWMADIGGGEGESLGPCGPYETEDLAKIELNKAARALCLAFEHMITGKVSGEYIDMKTNERRKWDLSNGDASTESAVSEK